MALGKSSALLGVMILIVIIQVSLGDSPYGRNRFGGPCEEDGDCPGHSHCHQNEICLCRGSEEWDRRLEDQDTGLQGRCAIPKGGFCYNGEGWSPCKSGLRCKEPGPSWEGGYCA